MAYRCVILDLGRVLVHFEFARGYSALESLCPHPAASIPKLIAPTGLVRRFETGLMEPRDFVDQLCGILDLKVDYNQFCGIWSSIFTERLVPERMLAGLKSRYKLLLLSNTNAIHFEMIRETYWDLLRHFDEFVLSYEVKAMKPDPRIYQAALRKAGCEASECFYADDIAAYVEGARQAGIDAVQFESAEQLQCELAARGIEWE